MNKGMRHIRTIMEREKMRYNKDWKIDIAKSGHLELRRPDQQIGKGMLPVFSTATQEQAEQIQTSFGKLQYDGSYRVSEFSGQIDEIGKLTEQIELHQQKKEKANAF